MPLLRRLTALGSLACALALPATAATYYVVDGTTSINFDAGTVADAGLTGPLAVDVPVASSTFGFSTLDYSVWGELHHSGAASFFDSELNEYTIGNLVIGYDASRGAGGMSGLYVADTVGGFGILFDIGVISDLWLSGNTLAAGPVGLYVASELATLVGDLDFAGRGAGTISFEGTVRQGASAVPDESTYAVSAIMFGALMLAGRVRAKSARRLPAAA